MKTIILLLSLLASPAYAQRIVPTGDVVMHVSPAVCANSYWPDSPGTTVVCGSDTTGDGSLVLPFATMAKAHDTLMANYDLQCRYKATIQLAVGIGSTQIYYAPGLLISGRLLGQCGTVAPLKFLQGGVVESLIIGKYLPYTLRGDPANPTGAFCFGTASTAHLPCISLSDGAGLKVEGITVNTQGYDQDCIDVFNGSFLEISNVWWGYCGYPNYFLGIGVAQSSNVFVTGPLTITGQMTSFLQIAGGSVFQGNADTGSPLIPITIMNNPVMQQGLFVVDHALVYTSQFSFAGTINGSKALIVRGGALFTGSGCAAGIPGTAPTVEAGSVCN